MQKFIDISKIHKGRLIGEGTEGYVYLLLDDPDYVYKEYDDLKPSLSKSKILNISAIMDISNLDKYAFPIESMVVDKKNDPNKLLGVVKKTDYSKPITDFVNEQRIIALYTFKDILEELNKLHVRHFDLRPDNIRHKGDPKKVLLGDMDSAYFDGIESDYCYAFISYYLRLGGKPDFNAIIYIFNFITYVFLTKSSLSFEDKLKYVDYKLTSKNLDTPRINKFCKSMFNGKVDQIADHEYLIDIINDEIKVENNKFVKKIV
jgi:hypothetical protein